MGTSNMTISLRHTWKCATLLLCLCASGAFPAVAADKITIRHAINSVTAVNWPDFVATSKGFNDREGLDVETVLLPAESIVAALVGGSVEVGLANATQLALSDDKGANLVAVGIGAENQPYHLIAAPAIKTLAALKDVIYGNGQNQRFAAILSGAVQAGLFSSPADADLVARAQTRYGG
jgi:ABC-type nitrate/sulfonate/bicarbonate transport system substrate-binding protein